MPSDPIGPSPVHHRHATCIEVSTLITPHHPVRPSDDDDQTGVRAMLSGLPEPDPMPAHLIERISASLAAEQAQRSALVAGRSVLPLLATRRRRPGRFLFALAGAAAAVAMIGVVGSNLLTTNQTTAAGDSAAADLSRDPREASGAPAPSADDKAVAGGSASPASIQIRSSDTRYTLAGFMTQARMLSDATFAPGQGFGASRSVGAIGTESGLTDCLRALGADGAQTVRADLAFYEGQPAVVIVATTGGIPTAYAVGRECSRADAAFLHPPTPLP